MSAKPDGCQAGVGSACETHAAAVHSITERLHKEVEARPDKDRYQATLDGTTAINEQYDQYFSQLCATVPETTVDAATNRTATIASPRRDRAGSQRA